MDYGTFLTMLEDQEVAVAQVEEDVIYFTDKADQPTLYSTNTFNDPYLVDRLYDSGCEFGEVKAQEMNPILSFLLTFVLPIVIFIVIGQLMSRYLMNKMGAGPMGNAMQFGKSSAKVYIASETGIKFSDVAGEEEAKENLMEIVDFLHNPQKYQAIGAKMPKACCWWALRAPARLCWPRLWPARPTSPSFPSPGLSSWRCSWVWAPTRSATLFRQANEKAPCIVFIDEIDTIGKKRDGSGMGGNDEREQTLNQLLTEMDGFEASKGVVILPRPTGRRPWTPPCCGPAGSTGGCLWSCRTCRAVRTS